MKAIIYARVSSSGDRQSTDRQVKDLTDYAAFDILSPLKGWIFAQEIA